MIDERDELVMSQLADGELSSDRANALLLGVLDDPAGRAKLKALLELRQATAGWRERRPDRPVVALADRPARPGRGRFARRFSGLAVAACLGGLLVLAGVWAAGGLGSPVRPMHQWQIAPGPDAPPAVARVTPEQMREVAKVFALHESVAGPLAWYAADDQDIRLASARGTEVGQTPIAVLLTLAPAGPGAAARTLVIVCREREQTVVELPAVRESPGTADRPALRVYLAPRTVDGHLDVQYAIAMNGDGPQAPGAAVSGERQLGARQTPLGQLALGERLLNIEAAAWPMRQESNR